MHGLDPTGKSAIRNADALKFEAVFREVEKQSLEFLIGLNGFGVIGHPTIFANKLKVHPF